MRSLETDNHAVELHEIQITIDISELYAEIVEVYKADENGPGFVLVTSIKAIEPNLSSQENLDSDFRRLGL